MRNVLFEIASTTRQIGAGFVGMSVPIFFVRADIAWAVAGAGFAVYVFSIVAQVFTADA